MVFGHHAGRNGTNTRGKSKRSIDRNGLKSLSMVWSTAQARATLSIRKSITRKPLDLGRYHRGDNVW